MKQKPAHRNRAVYFPTDLTNLMHLRKISKCTVSQTISIYLLLESTTYTKLQNLFQVKKKNNTETVFLSCKKALIS